MAELTRAQASAVTHRGSTVLVSAAAGSGKTRVLQSSATRLVLTSAITTTSSSSSSSTRSASPSVQR